jgi:L-serine dehydratase
MSLNSLNEIVTQCEKNGIKISEYVIAEQMEETERTRDEILAKMSESLKVMRQAINEGMSRPQNSLSGLTEGSAYSYAEFVRENALPGGKLFNLLITYALAVSEVNACMGRIVAAPTAGSCGILPALLFSLDDEYGFGDEALVNALFNASGVGAVIAKRATLSGAEGGCQAECGSASAMAAAAGAELLGGTPEMCAHACAMALKNTLGLVCDPVAGLVEVPCVKRNVMGAVNALSCMNMALAGIKSVIPADEVIDAMGDIGAQIHTSLRETSEGGLAVTPTGQELAKKIEQKK